MAEIIAAEDGFLLARVVRFDGNGDFLILVYFGGRKRRGRLRWRRGMVARHGGQRQPKQQLWNSLQGFHFA